MLARLLMVIDIWEWSHRMTEACCYSDDKNNISWVRQCSRDHSKLRNMLWVAACKRSWVLRELKGTADYPSWNGLFYKVRGSIHHRWMPKSKADNSTMCLNMWHRHRVQYHLHDTGIFCCKLSTTHRNICLRFGFVTISPPRTGFTPVHELEKT